MKDLVIFGTRQIAEVCAYYFEHDSAYRVAGFTVDAEFLDTDRFHGRQAVAFEEVAKFFPPNEHDMFIAIGYGRMNTVRAAKFAAAKALGYALARYVSTKAVTWPHLTIGENSFVMEANVIQPFASVGNDTIVWSGNHIGHHARVGDHCFLASHTVVSGNVEIGDYSFIGVNATIRDGIKIAPRCLIGAGALILKDTKPDEVYAAEGTPAAKVPSFRLSP